MIEKFKLGENAHGLLNSKADKEHKLIQIGKGINPVLSFLKKHNIPLSEVNSKADILNHFKKDFPFPNAPQQTNFELLGIDISQAANGDLLRGFKKDYHIVNGQVMITPEWYAENLEKYTHYTKTPEDVKAYEYANKLMELVQEGMDQGFLEGEEFREISRVNGLVMFSRGKVEYKPYGIYHAAKRHASYLAKQ